MELDVLETTSRKCDAEVQAEVVGSPSIDEEDGTINVVIETSRGARRARTLLDEAIERHAQE